MRRSFLENLRRVCFLLTAMLLAISLSILSPDSLAANADGAGYHRIDHAGGAVRLWGDEYHKVHLKRRFAISRWEPARVPTVFFQEPEEILAAGDAPIPAGQLKEARTRPWNCPRC